MLEEDQHLPAPSVLWSPKDIHKYVCQCCRSLETCCSSGTLLVLVPARTWIPHVSATSQPEPPKAAEALRQRRCRTHFKVFVYPNCPFLFGGNMGHGFLNNVEAPPAVIAKGIPLMSKVPSPSCSSRLLHSGEEITPRISDWTPKVGFSSRLRSSIFLLDGDISVCCRWKLLREAMEMWPSETRGGWSWSPVRVCSKVT